MSNQEFKVGDVVRVVRTLSDDRGRVSIGEIGVVKSIKLPTERPAEGTPGVFVDFGRAVHAVNAALVRDGAYAMWNTQVEHLKVIPEGPFAIRVFNVTYDADHTTDGVRVSWYVSGRGRESVFYPRRVVETNIASGAWTIVERTTTPPAELMPDTFTVRLTNGVRDASVFVMQRGDDGLFRSAGDPAVVSFTDADARMQIAGGTWELVTEDPVVIANREVQRLPVEQQAADEAVSKAEDAADAARKLSRTIGQRLSLANLDADRINHEAAGLKWEEPVQYKRLRQLVAEADAK